MTPKGCPSEQELMSFVDEALSPEQLTRIEAHVTRCAACRERVEGLRSLIDAMAAPLPLTGGQSFDVAGHVAKVMGRLDEAPRKSLRSTRTSWMLGFSGLAAAAALLFVVLPRQPGSLEGTYLARGGVSEATLSRDVGLQLYAHEASPRALSPGSRVTTKTALTAGLRNLAAKPAHLLLFAVDARGTVHWISPQYVDPSSDPVSTLVAPSPQEVLLPSAVVFDDLSPGVLRVVALISEEPGRVSQVDALTAEQLSAERLIKRFPKAEVRQVALEVSAE